MEFDDRAMPLTRRQLDIWLSQETGHSGTVWQLSPFARIDGTVERDAPERAIRRGLQEAEPCRAAFFETDGQVFQRATDYSDVELALYDLSGSHHPITTSAPNIPTVLPMVEDALARSGGPKKQIELNRDYGTTG
jgi:hypothetical protein